ncbi:DNA topology modulation protein FlaR [Bacillus sp. B1-b2]|nr:DNA topology modulation protein FlaR [Bacillus sp. B1-b2]
MYKVLTKQNSFEINPKKIHIIGSVGSGKTTLAKTLSKTLNIPFYELDNVVWVRGDNGDVKRTEIEREAYLQTLVKTESWIIEGVHQEDWVAISFQYADIIIFLDPNYMIRIFRIIKRYGKQKLGIEKANYTPTFHIFKNMFIWNKYFEEVAKPHFFNKYSHLKDKTVILTNTREFIQQMTDPKTEGVAKHDTRI